MIPTIVLPESACNGLSRATESTMANQKELVPMIPWLYDLFLWIFSVLVDLFFREVHPRGSWKVPRRGPIIFVAAPHANQVDNTPDTSSKFTKTKKIWPSVRRSSDPNACCPDGSPSSHCLSHCGEIYAAEIYWRSGARCWSCSCG